MVLSLLFSQALMCFLAPAVSAAVAVASELHPAAVERYAYRVLPQDGEADSRLIETADVEIHPDGDLLQYVSRVMSATAREVTILTMDRKGVFLSGIKTVSDAQGKTLQRFSLRRDAQKVSLNRTRGSKVKVEQIDLPDSATLAVDASLLILLRTYPFETGKAWTLFMVDFSGASITVTVRQAGVDTITTPAGNFECYRMEVLVNVPLLRPKITYWIARQSPHFLVKSIGKRGPFTPSYEMTLTSAEAVAAK